MPTPPLPAKLLQQAVEAYEASGRNMSNAAASLGINRSTLQGRIRDAEQRGIKPGAAIPEQATNTDPLSVAGLRDRIRTLESELKFATREQLDAEYVKAKIIGLGKADPTPPAWLMRPNKTFSGPGVPTLFCSDLHWGEIVDPNQIGGVNRYSITIAQERLRCMVEVATDLLTSHLKFPKFPGIVFALGGDMVSGDIHEELVATNEAEIMPVVLDLWACLTWAIERLADTFGSVFVPCVSGNHGRNTHKIRAKGRNFTSFDWLLYQFLAKRFESDKRVKFMIPDGPDCYYSVMGHRYLLTHGDQFRGGDGMIGALGPIIRGDHKKRSRNAQIGMEYDTMLMGHWHQLIQLRRLIVNGSLKGYDEYANQNNFGFEPPQQALWLTHPTQGITFSAPVHVERAKQAKTVPQWVSWRAAA
jgi:transposase-like protein